MPMLKQITPAHYRPGLDVLRLAALLPVLCYHFCAEAATLGLPIPPRLLGVAMASWVEVGLAWFFLLSGAALCLQWQRRFSLRPYLVGRAAATYPPFWLGFAVLFVYGEVLHGNNPGIPRWRLIFSVVGLDGYLTPATVTFYKIGEWFLGVILILYLLFPLLLRCMAGRRGRILLAVGLVALQLAWPALCPAPWEAGHTVLGRLPAFALGVWFGTLLAGQGNEPPKALRLAVAIAIAVAALLLVWPVLPLPTLALLLVLAAGLFWVVYPLGQRLPAAVWPVLRRAAALCYCAYLTHHVLLTILLLPLTVRLALPLPVAFLLYLAATGVAAAVLQFVSAPFCKALRRLS